MSEPEVNEEDIVASNLATLKHVHTVRSLIYVMVEELDRRATNHDRSKFEEPEQSVFASTFQELGKTPYGTPEYEDLLRRVKPALDHHYANNRHHPEHWPHGIDDMTLIDLVEMLCDWKAATQRNKDGNIRKSVEHNAKRFGMSDQLRKIFENTVREMFQE